MKKILSVFISGIVLVLVLGACTAKSESSEVSQKVETSTSKEVPADTAGFTLNYTAAMAQQGFEVPLVLEKIPTRVVIMSTSPVMTLYELGVNVVAIPTTNKTVWPADLTATAAVLNTRADNFDIESIIALEPDLALLLPSHAATYGVILEDADIPVYYIDSGRYASIKALTHELVSAFAKGSEAGINMLNRFEVLEQRIEKFNVTTSAGKSAMIIHNAPPSTRIQTSEDFVGSIIDMFGYVNVNEAAPSSNMPVDMEIVINYDPDYIFAISSVRDIEDFETLMQQGFDEIPDFWNSFDAIVNDNIFYLPLKYKGSLGIDIIDDIHELMDMIEEHEATK